MNGCDKKIINGALRYSDDYTFTVYTVEKFKISYFYFMHYISMHYMITRPIDDNKVTLRYWLEKHWKNSPFSLGATMGFLCWPLIWGKVHGSGLLVWGSAGTRNLSL